MSAIQAIKTVSQNPMPNSMQRSILQQELIKHLTEWDGTDNLSPQAILEALIRAKTQREDARRKRHIEETSKRELPVDWHNTYEDDPDTEQTVDNVGDALLLSLEKLARVDIEYIAQVTRRSCAAVIDELADAIWQNPDTWEECFYKGWETRDQYLSGQLLPKLEAARKAAEVWPIFFKRNVKALEAVMPQPIAAEDIYITLGSPWIPSSVIDNFIDYLFKSTAPISWSQYDTLCGQWSIKHTSEVVTRLADTRALFGTYGTRQFNALKLLEKTLNRLKIKDVSLSEKQKKLQKAFQKWLKTDQRNLLYLQSIYDKKFGFQRKRTYDGSFLMFPNMTTSISLYPHQRNAIARILLSGNTLLAHGVGSGKTFIMIAAAMEMKRIGRSAKNVFIVPNNLVGQWRESFLKLYPSANIITVESKDFDPEHRIQTLNKMRMNVYDGIIIAYSCAERMPLSLQWNMQTLVNELNEIEHKKEQYGKKLQGRIKTVLSERLNKLERRIKAIREKPQCDIPSPLCFDNLGFTGFFLDESHNYKNIPIETSLSYLRGINSEGSTKCADMLARARAVTNNGGVVVLATGTPISNSITDVYNIQQYLQQDTLRLFELESFDAWAGNFAEIKEVFELDIDSTRFRTVERFVHFHNLPELSSIFGLVADFTEDVKKTGLPLCDGREDYKIKKTEAFDTYVKKLSYRADNVRCGCVSLIDDNLLKITTDGRKAALDLKLVDSTANWAEGKTHLCAKNVINIYHEYNNNKSVQIIFCDLSTPKKGFNVYDKLKTILVDSGIPDKEIAFVHDNDTPLKREWLYENARTGAIRILIGSTFKLGLGVNIQNKLIALHHLDAPWRPADMEQREGRILRKGNENPRVRIFRYVTEGSFDAYCWQILETKQRFIAHFLSDNLSMRSGEELESTALSFAEIKALAIGNPLMRKRVECATEIEHIALLQRTRANDQEAMRLEIIHTLEKEADAEKRLNALSEDIQVASQHTEKLTPQEKRELGQKLLFEMQLGVNSPQEKNLCEYRSFTVVLPSRLMLEKPGVWLSGKGRYFVEIETDPLGCVSRLEHTIKGFSKVEEELRKSITRYQLRRKDLEAELAEQDPYVEKLKKLKTRLRNIDKMLSQEVGI